MELMHISATGRARTGRTPGAAARTVTAAAALLLGLAACGGSGGAKSAREREQSRAADSDETAAKKADRTGIPGVGDRLESRIPATSRQVVAVHGEDRDSADATLRLYSKHGDTWTRERSWPAFNGRNGWTPDHREGDKRTPIGVFTLSDAGGVLADPGAKLPYLHSVAFTPSPYWPAEKSHDFDHVIAVDYNRVKGTSPLDPTRPQGDAKGGSIWLHVAHGYGTSGCVSLKKSGMAHLLRTLDPDKNPVVVMGDKATLAR